VPVFFNVTVCAELLVPVAVPAKVMLVGVSVTAGFGAAAPVPLSATNLVTELLLISIDAERVPVAVGLNDTAMAHAASFGNVCEQLWATMKSLVADPVVRIPVNCREPGLVLRTVICWKALCVPCGVLEKLRLAGLVVNEPAVCANTGPGSMTSTANTPAIEFIKDFMSDTLRRANSSDHAASTAIHYLSPVTMI
jgi:hypothetical protein